MVLKMSRPNKQSKSGIYQLRIRVPKHLIALEGKAIVKVSLKTRDPAEAKVRHARLLADMEARWLQMSAGVLSLSQKQAVALSGAIYRELVAKHEDDPGEPGHWNAALAFDYAHLRPEKVRIIKISKDEGLIQQILDRMRHGRNDKAINAYLDRHGYRLDEPSMVLVRKAVADAVLQAKEHLLKLSRGDYRPDPDGDRFPAVDLTPMKNKSDIPPKYQLLQVFDDFFAEKQQSPQTYKKWKGLIKKAAVEVPDIRDLTGEWVVDWKDRLLKQGLSAVYVRDSHLACLRATCNWAKSNLRIKTNPLDGLSVAAPKKITTRKKDFTPVEAATILKASLIKLSSRYSPEAKAGRRWIPWLCAYTGARVGEIAQLRKEDIQEHDGHLLIWITPEAGSTKNKNPRYVAIHPHLVEQGFMDFVRPRRKGPLFYDPSKHRGGTQGNPQYNKVAERLAKWVRELGVDDVRIRPNHAWRHLFKTEARGVGMDAGTRDYMQGHVPATEGEAYGGFKPHVLAREIAKFPKFKLD